MRIACEKTFKTKKATKKSQRNRSVPWWTHELTVMRKTTNHLRRKYQRTRDNAEQRETKGDKQSGILRTKSKMSCNNKKGKNEIVERILQPNNRSQPLTRGI